jgi:hypothetical protein
MSAAILSRAALLAAAVAELPATAITITARVACKADADTWVEALGLTDVALRGQPHPLAAPVPDFWIATLAAQLPGSQVEIVWHKPHTPEHEAEWIAQGGPKSHPRAPVPTAPEPTLADEPRCPDPECGEPLALIASGAVGHCGRSCTPADEPQVGA